MSENSWKITDLGAVAHIEMGQAPSSEYVTDREIEGAHPFLQGNAEFTDTAPRARLWCSRFAKSASAGDSLISVRAPVGELNQADQDYAIGRGLAAIRFQSVLPKYGYHQLALRKTDLHRVAQGSTFDAVGSKELKGLAFPVPPLEEQRRIAEILDALDDQVRTAESITAKLVTLEDGMLTDLLNAVPRDHDRRLEHLLLVPPRNGYSPVAAAWPTGEYMLGLGCLTTRGFVPRQLKNAPIGDLRLRPFLLKDGDILISRSNTRDLVGLAGVFREVNSPCYYPDLMMRLVPSNSVSSEYLALVLSSHQVRRQIMNAASGTSGSMVKITKSTVGSLYLPIPSRPEQDRIASTVQRLRRTLDCELDKLQKLRRLKSGLRADLLTGRVRLPLEVAS